MTTKMMNELSGIVGEKNVSIQKIDKLVYSSDASQIHGKTRIVVWTENKGQVQKIVRYAKKNHLNIVARGAGTGLAGGVVPDDSIILDFSKMNNILKLNVKGRSVVVEPGVILNDLNNYLKNFELFFPVIPASYRVCTIGGMISTNAAGERAVKYGETMCWVIGLEVVDGNENIRTLKKREEIEEFCGTEGFLGIITKTKLFVTEPIKNRSMNLLKFDNISDLIDVVKNQRFEDDVIAIEFINKSSAKLAGLEEKYYLFIEFESDKGEIKSTEEMERIWNLRERIGPVLSSAEFLIMEDPKIPIGKMEYFLIWLEKNKIPAFGHIGMGIIHPRFKKTQKKLIREMFRIVEKLNGQVSGEHGIGLTKKKFAKKDFIMRIKTLKEKYDPEKILNKGKIMR